MIINRDDASPIIKNKLDRDNLERYNEEKIKTATPLIDKVLEENSVSTFDMLTLLRKVYKTSLLDAYNSVSIEEFEKSQFNCVYLARLLKEELKKIDIDASYLSHQAREYALECGDKKIKEAHVSLIYPALDRDNVKYTIFDPGLKIQVPLTFLENGEYNITPNQNQNIKITYNASNNNYPYAVNMYGISPYSYTNYPHLVYQRFNPEYLVQNVGEMLYPYSHKLLTGYKATIFTKEEEKRAYIRLDHLDQILEYCDYKDKIINVINFSDLNQMNRNVLITKLQSICRKLKIDVDELVDDIMFMVELNDEFISEIMDNDVKQEYQRTRKLK